MDRALCSLHGQCVLAAPELFSFDAAGDLVYLDGPLDTAQARAAEAAAAVCPAAAIEVVP